MLVGLSLVVASCGERSDEDKITDVVNGFVKAVAQKNGVKACSYYTRETKAMFDNVDHADCAKVVLYPETLPTSGKVSKIQLNGQKATVTHRQPNGELRLFYLVKRGSDWKIDLVG